jgi:hypothetical protein
MLKAGGVRLPGWQRQPALVRAWRRWLMTDCDRLLCASAVEGPMTVAARPQAKKPLAERLEALEIPLENLVLAGRQLELNADEIVDALRAKWEKNNG